VKKNSFRKISASDLKVGDVFLSVNSYTGDARLLEVVEIPNGPVYYLTAAPPGHEYAPGCSKVQMSCDCAVFVP
jgi:hypothetical protein